MNNRFSLFILLSCIIVSTGCSNNLNRHTTFEEVHSINELKYQSSPDGINDNYKHKNQISDSNNVLNLNNALSLTLLHNPELKAYSLAARAAEAHQLQESLRPNPELDIEIEEFGGSRDRSGFKSAETTIQLSQTIELGGKLKKRERIARLEKELKEIEYQIAKSEILKETTKAFYQVLSAQEKLKLSDDLLYVSTEFFEAVKKRVDAGKDSPLEISRASIALSNAKTENQQANIELKNARNYLSSILGVDQLPFKQVEGDLYEIQPIKSFDYYTEHLINNPIYKLWETEVAISKAELDLEKSKSIVDMTLGAGIVNYNETDDNAFVLGMSIPLPVSDRNQGARQEAIYNLAQKKQKQKAEQLNQANLTHLTYNILSHTYNIITTTKESTLPAAINLYDSANTSYLEGKIDYINMLDAQLTLFEVKKQYIDSTTSYHIIKAEIDSLINIQYTTNNK